jgi:hypothetical protein
MNKNKNNSDSVKNECKTKYRPKQRETSAAVASQSKIEQRVEIKRRED